MKIDIEQVGNILKIVEMLGDNNKPDNDSHFFNIGKNYLIRTVTMIYTGKLKAVSDKEILIVDASWIADTGRFHDALKSCDFLEVEPFINDVIIGRNAIVDATIIDGLLPNEQK